MDSTMETWGSERSHKETCFHREESFEIVREAEQTCILFDSLRHQYHISVTLNGWFCCKILSEKGFEHLSEMDIIKIVQRNLSDLRLVQE